MGEGARRRFVKSVHTGLLLLSILCFGLAAYYGGHYLIDTKYLRQYVRSHYGAQFDLAAIEQLAVDLERLPRGETTARLHYWNPLMRFLRATPRQVLEHGGFCGNKVRLMVTLLSMEGIKARKMYIYNVKGLHLAARPPYVHNVVEFWYEGRWAVADPHNGVLFRRVMGEPATLADMRSDPTLVLRQLRVNSGLAVTADQQLWAELLSFQSVRRVRWNKLPWGERLYALLVLWFDKQTVDELSYPYVLTQPYLVLMFSFGLGALVLLLARFYLPRCNKLSRQVGASMPLTTSDSLGEGQL